MVLWRPFLSGTELYPVSNYRHLHTRNLTQHHQTDGTPYSYHKLPLPDGQAGVEEEKKIIPGGDQQKKHAIVCEERQEAA